MKQRLDQALVARGLVRTRSQAESYVRLGDVLVNGAVVRKPGALVSETDVILPKISEQYVSRAALKLKSAAEAFGLDFRGKTVLDVGSSTGGFTQYALRRGAKKVIAVDVGTDQLHPSLHGDERIELHEKTDIRDFRTSERVDMAVADVSFISLREILLAVLRLTARDAELVMMVKPQFEARHNGVKHKGVIKNDRMRRDILKGFEEWVRQYCVIVGKADSEVPGAKGNLERFYLLKKL
ncbi:MAG TPA: TlyA family RNA methyltransferase [Candidatus Saccharimonadales bacterium]